MAAAGAAAEAASNAARGAEAYVGSLISLISKSDIRYEGFLFQLDAQESTIALRNVKSFGTEERRQDGTQVAPSERIYEYIYFRGSDIKDLQVISSPPVQSMPTVPDDPAIIQSHHSHPSSTTISLASHVALGGTNISSNPHLAVHVPPFQGNSVSLQSVEVSSSWASVLPVPPVNVNGPTMQSYWPGFTGLPGANSHFQQQTYPPQPHGLLLPNLIQQQLPHPSINASLAGNALNFAEPPHTLLPPVSSVSLNLISTMSPPSTVQYSHIPLSTLLSNPSSTPMSSNASSALPTDQPLPTEMVDSGSHMESPLVTASEVNPVVPPVTVQTQSLLGPAPFPMISKSTSSFVGSSTNFRGRRSNVSPIPGSFWHQRPVEPSSSHHLQVENSDFGLASNLQPSDSQNFEELELPKSPARKLYDRGSSSHYGSRHHGQGGGQGRGDLIYGDMLQYQSNRGHMQGRGRGFVPNRAYPHNHQTYRGHPVGRGNWLAGTASYPRHVTRGLGSENGPNAVTPYYRRHGGIPAWGGSEAVTNFSEDFDFEAMNEKFNKEEVWGILGKNKSDGSEDKKEEKEGDRRETADESGDGLPKLDPKYSYRKDDFFDSISCTALDGDSQRGKKKFSELRKIDAETFGEIPQHQRAHGFQGPYRGGHSQGSYRGRGYDNAGRGRVKTVWSRVT